ncbi:hypothetical protein AXF42_Ash007978 [Apostasia shenzhenica]|uniref:Uncharacterized protein n=1 Tax=Apostasia shenzhenica TaxID=1088818 RepID=A0A2I0B5W9_9ASPA|nr:hypothetical protein AXF42_Ash007978 [Apostasia shenzhenica]
MSALKADNKALREKLSKVDGDREAAVVSSSIAAVEAYKTSLPCRKERLDGIRRAWEGLASSLVQGGDVKAAVLGELDPFPCMAVDPIYKEEGFDLTDDIIQQFFDLLDEINEVILVGNEGTLLRGNLYLDLISGTALRLRAGLQTFRWPDGLMEGSQMFVGNPACQALLGLMITVLMKVSGTIVHDV